MKNCFWGLWVGEIWYLEQRLQTGTCRSHPRFLEEHETQALTARLLVDISLECGVAGFVQRDVVSNLVLVECRPSNERGKHGQSEPDWVVHQAAQG